MTAESAPSDNKETDAPRAGVDGRGIAVRGDDIDTDRIIPARFLRCVTFDGLGEHAFEDDRKNYPDGLHPFDREEFKGAAILVVNRNFGCGSSREHAPRIIKLSGVGAVIAESFARIFFRNCANVGLMAIICPTDNIDDGDRLIIHPDAGRIEDVTRGLEIRFESLPEVMRKILDSGGLVPYVMAHGGLDM